MTRSDVLISADELLTRMAGTPAPRLLDVPIRLDRPVGCRAKAETNTRVITIAPMMGATGVKNVASRPTRKGPKTKMTSSAADS